MDRLIFILYGLGLIAFAVSWIVRHPGLAITAIVIILAGILADVIDRWLG